MVVAVGFPAASFSVTVMSNGAPPGQVTGTQASVLIAVTAAVPTQVVEPPSETHRLLTAAPERRRQSGRVGGRRPAADAEPALAIEIGRPEELSVRRLRDRQVRRRRVDREAGQLPSCR